MATNLHLFAVVFERFAFAQYGHPLLGLGNFQIQAPLDEFCCLRAPSPWDETAHSANPEPCLTFVALTDRVQDRAEKGIARTSLKRSWERHIHLHNIGDHYEQ
jgi:hypothetical protein